MQITGAIVWSLHPLSHLYPSLPTCRLGMSAHGFPFFFPPSTQPNNLCHIVLLSSNINNVHLTVHALENYVSIELSFPEIFCFWAEIFHSRSRLKGNFSPHLFPSFRYALLLFLILKPQQYVPVTKAVKAQTSPQPVTMA